MKKMLLKISVIAFAAIALTSCLGSNTGTFSASQDYAVFFTDPTYGIYARASSGNILTSPDMQEYRNGDAAILSYSVSTKNQYSNGLFVADNLITTILPQTNISYNLPIVTDSASISFTSLGSPTYSSSNYFADKWFIPFVSKLKGGESAAFDCFYDADRQTAIINSKPLDGNFVILDLRARIYNSPTDTIPVNKNSTAVADLSSIRTNLIFADKLSKDKPNLNIYFRYYVPTYSEKNVIRNFNEILSPAAVMTYVDPSQS